MPHGFINCIWLGIKEGTTETGSKLNYIYACTIRTYDILKVKNAMVSCYIVGCTIFCVAITFLWIYMSMLNSCFSEFRQGCLHNVVCDIKTCCRPTKGHPASCWGSYCHVSMDNACYLWNGEERCMVDSIRYGVGGGTLIYMLRPTGVWYYICDVRRKA
jgi:hypothetical protein